jgi:hypothetical protein
MSDQDTYRFYEAVMKMIDEAVAKDMSASEVISATTAVLAEIIKAAPMDQRPALRATIYDSLLEQLGRVWIGQPPKVPGAPDNGDDHELH